MSIELDEISSSLPVNTTEISNDRPLTPVEDATNTIAQLALDTPSAPSSPLDPNRFTSLDPGKEAILAGAEFEKRSTNDLKTMENKSNEIIKSIDLLLDLSREAGKLNADKPLLNDEMKSILSQLKERGINLLDLPEGKEFDKEQLATLKSALGSHMDKLRTEVQQIFTKMQTVIQNMSSVNDSIKKMITEQADLIRKILDRSIKH